MRCIAYLILSVACCVTTAFAQIGQTAVLGKMNGHDGSDSYVILSPEAFRAKEKELRDEARYYRKALAAAKKAWEADKAHEKEPFPATGIKLRKIRAMGRFRSEADAQKKVDVYEDRMIDSETKREKEEKEDAARKLKRVKNKTQRARMQEKLKEEAARKEEKAELTAEAIVLFEEELTKLTGRVAAPAE